MCYTSGCSSGAQLMPLFPVTEGYFGPQEAQDRPQEVHDTYSGKYHESLEVAGSLESTKTSKTIK